MRGARMGLILSVVLAATAVAAAPAAAATTRWVAKDGKAGPSTCAGTAAASTTIQAAVLVSASGDTVVVCDGTYRETVDILGRSSFTLKAAHPGKATIRTPASVENGIVWLMRIVDGSGVSIRASSSLPTRSRPAGSPTS